MKEFSNRLMEENTIENSGEKMENSFSPYIGIEEYSENIISDICDDIILTKDASDQILEKIQNEVGDFGSIITFNVECSNHDNLTKYSTLNQEGAKKSSIIMSNIKKVSGFFVNFSGLTSSEQEMSATNICNSSRPRSCGIIINANRCTFDIMKKNGFKVVTGNDNSYFFCSKDDMKNISYIEIFDKTNKKASFVCDVAKTLKQKMAGLQVYPSLKYGSALIFPYDRPQDVLYHMGTVDFPIDIIFVDQNNKIKKICKNIAPGSLATFGCASTSNVIEVISGTTDILDIDIGDEIRISELSDDFFYKYSQQKELIGAPTYQKVDEKDTIIKTNDFSIVSSFETFLKTPLGKTASQKNIKIYNIQPFLSKSKISVFKNDNEEVLEIKSFIRFASRVNGYTFVPNKWKSFKNFLAKDGYTFDDIRRMAYSMVGDIKNGTKVVVASCISDTQFLKELFMKRIAEDISLPEDFYKISFITIDNNASDDEILDFYRKKFGGNIQMVLTKEAAIPIPDKIKTEAKNAYEKLKKVIDITDDVIEKLKNNSSEFEKLKQSPQSVKKYKGAYQQSCKKIAAIVYKMLSVIKESMQIMEEIKDISSVDEKIDGLAASCKKYIDGIEEVFSLVEDIDNDGFIEKLTEKTKNMEGLDEDIKNNTNNFIDYISDNILNKRILSR